MIFLRLALHTLIFTSLVLFGLLRLLWDALESIQPIADTPVYQPAARPNLSFSVSAEPLQEIDQTNTYHA